MAAATSPAPDAGDSHALASIIRGMAVGLLASIIGGGFGFAFPVVMAHLLGSQSEFGLLVLAVNLLTTGSALSIAAADFATIRFVAAADTPGRKRGAMVTPLALALTLNSALALGLLVFAKPLSQVIVGQEDLQPLFADVLRALAAVLPLTVLAQMLSAGLSGLEQLKGELARKTFEQGGRIVCGATAIGLGFGLVAAVLGMAIAAGAAVVAVGFLLLRALPRGGQTERMPVGKVLSFTWAAAIARAGTELGGLSNLVILGHSASARSVALFGAAFAIAALPALIYNSFSFRFMPSISRLYHSGDTDQLKQLLKGVTRWVVILAAPLYAIAIALPGPLLHIYGPGYEAAAATLAVIALAGLFNSATGPVFGALTMTGRVRLDMSANLIAAACEIALALVLIPRYGAVGAAFSLLVYSVLLNALKLFFVHRTLGANTLSWGLSGPIVAGALASALAAVLARVTFLGDSLPGVALLALILVAAYAVLMLSAVGVSGEDRRALALAIRPSR